MVVHRPPTDEYTNRGAVVLSWLFVNAGYWAYGASVDPFLLFATSKPVGLVVSAVLAAAVQIQLVSQVRKMAGGWNMCHLLLESWLCSTLASQAAFESANPTALLYKMQEPQHLR